MNDTDASSKGKRGPVHRSPSFPSIDLKAAIERARTFYQNEKRLPANVTVAAKHWGYSPQSSGGKLVLAALLSFGLMEDKGSGEQRQVKLTDLALRILLDERPGSLERREALQRAAFMPKIHSELFTKWNESLPSDPNLRHYLLIDKKFNENSVDDFIKELRSTADFAGIYAASSPESDSLEERQEETEIEELPQTGSVTSGVMARSAGQQLGTPATTPTSTTPAQAANVRQDTFSLDEGLVVLQWPAQLSKTSFEDLKDWMELQLRKISRSVQSAD
jgi:hypothetical protein